MIKLFKIKKRKVWHIDRDMYSYCSNAVPYNVNRARGYHSWTKDKEYSKQFDDSSDPNRVPDYDFVDYMKVDVIPQEVHDGLCKACVQHAFSAGKIKIVANKD